MIMHLNHHLYQILYYCMLVSFCTGVEYVEKYFDQKIDHFNFESHGENTFKQRYLYNDSWWAREQGPIFFYAGNEGAIDGFWRNTGFMMEIAPQFRALVLFAEHRYYGKSLPFGNASFEENNIGFLSVAQALADYAFFLKSFKKEFRAENCPVIAFGGSYGGMLAAYMRFKFPNVVHGAIAASSPIYLTAGKMQLDLFFQHVSKVFRNAAPKCEERVRAAYTQMDKWASAGQGGLDLISGTFRLCNPLQTEADYKHLLRWSRNAFMVAALMNYPYPASFMGDFPANPVKVMCDQLGSEENPASGLRSACGAFYNSSGDTNCFDIYEEYLYCADPTGCGLGSDSKAWDYQACTEINSEGGTDGVNDMFPVLPFNSSMRNEYCQQAWKTTPRRDWLDVMMWGKDILSSSNIVLSNGNLDPCIVGGVLRNLTESLVAYIIEGGAHHLDLRVSNEADPPSVRDARRFEIENIHNWLRQFYSQSNNLLHYM